MSWLALLLIGVGVTDLVWSVLHRHVVPECVGGAVVVLGFVAGGLTSGPDLVAMVSLVAVVIAWGQTVSRAFGGHIAVWWPLVVLGGGLLATALLSGEAGWPQGLVERWLGSTAFPVSGARPVAALMVLGVGLVQMSTGNVLVRLVLAATGTVNPARHGQVDDPETQLKGGRLLGPMERLFIVGLGLAGQPTAAAIVVAAKGLLRFPELSSRRDQERIHQLTEYFLVGSFVSWLVALSGLILVLAALAS